MVGEFPELKITIRLFASYKDRVGCSRLLINLPDRSTVGDLVANMMQSYPGLVNQGVDIVAAVNQEYQEHHFVLRDGDEVALIPPVSGG